MALPRLSEADELAAFYMVKRLVARYGNVGAAARIQSNKDLVWRWFHCKTNPSHLSFPRIQKAYEEMKDEDAKALQTQQRFCN